MRFSYDTRGISVNLLLGYVDVAMYDWKVLRKGGGFAVIAAGQN